MTKAKNEQMDKFQNYIAEVEQLLTYKEYNQLTKRLIDLSLDTEDMRHYKNMLTHLDWLDNTPYATPPEIEERYSTLFLSLKDALTQKAVQLKEEEVTLIEISNLIKKYDNGYFSLGPINLVLKENQMIGLVGENGNGKTTLLRLIAKELELSSGKIKYNFTYNDDYDLRSKLVYIPQRTPVWHGSLLSNLQFTSAMYGVKDEENELKVELVVARMGIRKYRNFAWGGLSSGFKMRFELARALLRNPKVMLIDEPLANLDILAQKNVLDDLKGIALSPFRPMGILLSSQQLYEVEKNSNDVLFLKDGIQKNLLKTEELAVEQQSIAQKEETTDEEPYMIEFETPWEIAIVREKMLPLQYTNLQINGGTYIVSLPYHMTHETFLHHVLKIGMPLTYFRDISQSTRRFFLS